MNRMDDYDEWLNDGDGGSPAAALRDASRKSEGKLGHCHVCGDSRWLALEYASDLLKADETIVRAAVGNDGTAIRCTSPVLQRNRDIVLVAVKNNPGAILYADSALYDDYLVVVHAVAKQGHLLMNASALVSREQAPNRAVGSPQLWTGTHVCKHGAERRQRDSQRGDHVSESWILVHSICFSSPEERLRARDDGSRGLYGEGANLQYLGAKMQNSRDVVRAAMETDKTALIYATPRLRKSCTRSSLSIPKMPGRVPHWSPALPTTNEKKK